ncbi:MAG: malate dehydrogenase [Candidatus Omnitrophota bacterium]|nr:malate dehydrogenase [Candidatus Omnitrophota bacterium]
MALKVSIIGAGAVGATLAQRVLESGIADVVLLDIAKNLACGKSLDLMDAAPIAGHERHITGTDDYRDIKDSSIVVITAGFTRKPGMAREDLIAENARIVRAVAVNIKAYSPGAITIVVTNPLDVMTYLAHKVIGSTREKVFGMAGILDGSRFIQLVSDELKVSRSSIATYMLGSHGDTMVPVLSQTRVSGKPIKELIPEDRLDGIIKRTCGRGAEIVNLLGTGSAYYSPSIAIFKMIDAVLNDRREALVVSSYLEGEYGLRDICIGVPCRIGKNGIEEIIELNLSSEERESFRKSAQTIKSSIELL